MPELPEIEILTRHLAPLICGRKILSVRVNLPKAIGPTSPADFEKNLRGAVFVKLSRRGKYLLFDMKRTHGRGGQTLVGHLGMTGRMYLLSPDAPLPKYARVVMGLDRNRFIFEDPRGFGRLTLNASALETLGPEPLQAESAPEQFLRNLSRSSQPIKVRLLDQTLVAGIGNIYASEALFRAGISPQTPARKLQPAQIKRLWRAIRETLFDAIECGSTIPLNYEESGRRDGLFYFGRSDDAPDLYAERLQVYDRAGAPCRNCGRPIKRLMQAARSTFYCPRCQS